MQKTQKIVSNLSTSAVNALYVAGIKVHVEHHRCRKDFSPRQVFKMSDLRRQTIDILEEAGDAKHLVVTPVQQIDAKGGKTVVHVIDLHRGLQWTGESKCHPADHYNRTEGINRAFDVAVEQMRRDSKLPDAITPAFAKPIDLSLLSPQEKDLVTSIKL